jgi:hypothetical protein
MKRKGQHTDWISVHKAETKLFGGILLLQGTMQNLKMGNYFSYNRLLATPIFREVMTKMRLFLLLKFLHFANKGRNEQVLPKIYKVKSVSDHMKQKF